MGLYVIRCITCQTPFTWFSGSVDQRCEKCKFNAEFDSLNQRYKKAIFWKGFRRGLAWPWIILIERWERRRRNG